jgi:gas vesicle protein
MERLGWFLLGGLVGVGAGVLAAPRPGRESRDAIVQDLNDRYSDMVGRTKLRASELMREACEETEATQPPV